MSNRSHWDDAEISWPDWLQRAIVVEFKIVVSSAFWEKYMCHEEEPRGEHEAFAFLREAPMQYSERISISIQHDPNVLPEKNEVWLGDTAVVRARIDYIPYPLSSVLTDDI